MLCVEPAPVHTAFITTTSENFNSRDQYLLHLMQYQNETESVPAF